MPIPTPSLLVVSLLPIAALASSLTACNAAGSDCPAGAHKNAESGVCIVLPAELKPDGKLNKSGDTSYLTFRNSKSLRTFTVWIEKPDDLDKRAKSLAQMASNDLKLVASGDTPNKGKLFHFHNEKGKYEFADVLYSGKQHFYRCEIQNTPIEDAKAMIEACKTVSGP